MFRFARHSQVKQVFAYLHPDVNNILQNATVQFANARARY